MAFPRGPKNCVESSRHPPKKKGVTCAPKTLMDKLLQQQDVVVPCQTSVDVFSKHIFLTVNSLKFAHFKPMEGCGCHTMYFLSCKALGKGFVLNLYVQFFQRVLGKQWFLIQVIHCCQFEWGVGGDIASVLHRC